MENNGFAEKIKCEAWNAAIVVMILCFWLIFLQTKIKLQLKPFLLPEWTAESKALEIIMLQHRVILKPDNEDNKSLIISITILVLPWTLTDLYTKLIIW